MTIGQRVELFGVPVDALTMDEAVDRIRGWVYTGVEHQHVALNAAKVVELTKRSSPCTGHRGLRSQ